MGKLVKSGAMALLLGASALAAGPVSAQHAGGGGFHGGGGGGFHGGGASGYHGSGAYGGGYAGGYHGGYPGGYHGGYYHGGYWGGGYYHGGYWGGGYWGPYYGGYWGAPLFWGGLGLVAGYALAAPTYVYDSSDYYDYGDAPVYPYPNAAPAPGAYDNSAPTAAPPGYDCDGWRWDAASGRYVAAKVACN